MKNAPKGTGRGKHLLEALLIASDGPRIKDEAWNFAICPHPEQTEVCCLYEYSLECETVKAEVALLSEKARLRESNMEKTYEWLRAHPAPKNREHEPEYFELARKAIPHFYVTSPLHKDVRFLAYCSHFPEKHWLEIPKPEREEIAKSFQPGRLEWGHTPAHMAKRNMMIELLETFQNSPLRTPQLALQLKPHPAHSAEYVFSLCWPRSDRMLLKDFKNWLEENRPKDQPPFERTGAAPSRKTSHKDLLKALGAVRLLRAFDGNFQEARFHSLDAADKPLYKDQSAWRKAMRKAEDEIECFNARMVRGE